MTRELPKMAIAIKVDKTSVLMAFVVSMSSAAISKYVLSEEKKIFSTVIITIIIIFHIYIAHFLYDTQMRFTILFGGLCQTANAVYN